jgi:hypothetical protein
VLSISLNLKIVLPLVLVSLLAQQVTAQVKQNRLRNTLTGSGYCLDIINDGNIAVRVSVRTYNSR